MTTLAGSLVESSATASALVSTQMLEGYKNYYDSDFINNALGDKLAEIGAVAMSSS